MNTILDCYFDGVFIDLPRECLLSRTKRTELVEYFSVIIEACTTADQCSRQEGCGIAVSSALKYHKDSKQANGGICLLGKFHNVLYVAMKLCFDFRLNDSAVVSHLLNEMFACEGTFERIFAGAIFGVRVSHFIAGWKSDFTSQEENITALTYFLKHAVSTKLKYRIGEYTKRFSDVPMTSVSNATPLRVAVQIPRPDIVLLLLQFGSAIKFDQGDGSYSSPLEPLLKHLSESDSYNKPSLDCLKILLRAFPTIGYLPTKAPDPDDYETTGMVCVEDRLIYDNIVPPSRCGITPPELKHLCRCAIRHSLWKVWQLPYGIYQLPLPPILMRYLNLLDD